MKKLALFLPFVLLIASCDKVTSPIVGTTSVRGTNFVTMSNKDVANSKKMLLEDFTGQRCPNCPEAADIIVNLTDVFETNLIAISIHQGGLAAPFGAKWPRNYTTAEGDIWGGSSVFGITEWPTGVFNRKDYNSNGIKLGRTKWTSIAPLANADPFIVRLDLVTEYDAAVRALNVNVKATFKTAYKKKLMIVACYIEEGIIGKQDKAGVEIEEYEFEHVFRGNINKDAAGDVFMTSAVAAGDSVKWSREGFPLPPLSQKGEKGLAINDENVWVVVYVYDDASKEVLQVEKVKIK